MKIKAIIKGGQLFNTDTGYQIHVNKPFLYDEQLSAFNSLADNSEIEIDNCWRSEDIRSKECTILYGNSWSFSVKSGYSKDNTIDTKNCEQSLIDKENNSQGVDSNGSSRDINSDNECGVSDSVLRNNVQNESDATDQIPGSNSE